jgi:citrate lyase subunit beta/citryl-CoA lyase
MPVAARPRRSVLYMPGSNPRALEKARALAADALILDLEDAVAPDAKAQARDLVAATVQGGGYGNRELVVRTNGLDTAWGRDDVIAAARAAPDAILLPKVEGAVQVQEAAALIEAHGAAKTAIWCMMETPKGMLHAEAIASASPRLACFVMGTNDLAKDLNARHTPMRLPMITALGLCLLAARAYGLAIIDGVFMDVKDEAGLAASCQQGVELGFDGKTLIHPAQLEAANRAFAPSDADVDHARRVVAAFAAARAAGKGVVLLDGKLIENLHVVAAERLLALHDAIEKLAA